MFLCLFGERIAVKLPDAKAQELVGVDGAAPFAPMEGRPMKGYVVLPQDWNSDTEKAEPWIEQSLAYVRTLPPKNKPTKKGT
jgi:hypothetical protein